MAVYNQVTPEEIFHNEEVKSYIFRGNDCLGAIGFTEHGFAHAKRSSDTAREILASLGYPQRQCQLAAIAGYMHDIGNTVNRVDHAHSGALMAFTMSLDDFVISLFTSGSQAQNLSVTIYAMVKRRVTPEINALSTLMFGAILLLLILVNVAQIRGQPKARPAR